MSQREDVRAVLQKVLNVLFFLQKPRTPYASDARQREYRQHTRAWGDVCAREHERFAELLSAVRVSAQRLPEFEHLDAGPLTANLLTACVDLERLMAWGRGEGSRDVIPLSVARIKQLYNLVARLEGFIADVESTSAAGSGR